MQPSAAPCNITSIQNLIDSRAQCFFKYLISRVIEHAYGDEWTFDETNRKTPPS